MEKPTGEMREAVKRAVLEFLSQQGFKRVNENTWHRDGVMVEVKEYEIYGWLKLAVAVKWGAATCAIHFTEYPAHVVPQYSVDPKCFAFKNEDLTDVEKRMDVVFEVGGKIYAVMEKTLHREIVAKARDREDRLFKHGLQILYATLVNSGFSPVVEDRSLWLHRDGVQVKVVARAEEKWFKVAVSRGAATCYIEYSPRENRVAPECVAWEYAKTSNEDEDIDLVFGLAIEIFEKLSKLITLEELRKE